MLNMLIFKCTPGLIVTEINHHIGAMKYMKEDQTNI